MRAALVLLCLTSPALAENVALDPPRTEAGARLEAELRTRAIATDLTYAASAEGIAKPKPPPAPDAPRAPLPVASWWILGGLVVALALWLRFGGAGILTRRAPQEGAPVTPATWDIEAPQAPASLLSQIAAMPDRRAALVRLLRHCLLRAAEESRTRLARSDTEREALARLPGDRAALRLILNAAELAHYGGRPVSEDGFAAALAAGQGILGVPRG